MQGWWKINKSHGDYWGQVCCLKTGCDVRLTTTEANADSSPFEFIAETRYCAVSSKSQLKEGKVTWTMSIIHILSLLRGPVFWSLPSLAFPPINYVNDTTWDLWGIPKLLTRNTLAKNRHRGWCHWKPAGFGLIKLSAVWKKLLCLNFLIRLWSIADSTNS